MEPVIDPGSAITLAERLTRVGEQTWKSLQHGGPIRVVTAEPAAPARASAVRVEVHDRRGQTLWRLRHAETCQDYPTLSQAIGRVKAWSAQPNRNPRSLTPGSR